MYSSPPKARRRRILRISTPTAVLIGIVMIILLIALLRPLLFNLSITYMQLPRAESINEKLFLFLIYGGVSGSIALFSRHAVWTASISVLVSYMIITLGIEGFHFEFHKLWPRGYIIRVAELTLIALAVGGAGRVIRVHLGADRDEDTAPENDMTENRRIERAP